jgi:predicted RNA-binding Zn ribbon-like protein
MLPVPQIEVTWVVNLVNEFSTAARTAAGEQDQPYPELAAPDGRYAGPGWTTAELVDAASELHQAFGAASRGEPAGPALNDILDRARPWPRAGPGGVRFAVTDAHDVLRAACALALLEWITARGAQRLGVCGAARCGDVFTDASAAGRRRFCSATCSTRHRVAQHRARQRSQPKGARG